MKTTDMTKIKLTKNGDAFYLGEEVDIEEGLEEMTPVEYRQAGDYSEEHQICYLTNGSYAEEDGIYLTITECHEIIFQELNDGELRTFEEWDEEDFLIMFTVLTHYWVKNEFNLTVTSSLQDFINYICLCQKQMLDDDDGDDENIDCYEIFNKVKEKMKE